MNIVELIGRVECIDGDTACVTLYEPRTGERIEAQCKTEVLNGTQVDREFSCVMSNDFKIQITPLAPKSLSEQQLKEIDEWVESKWNPTQG